MERDNKHTEPNVLKQFAHLLGTKVKNGRVEIPERFGRGYCAGYVFNEHIRMLILNYELETNVVIKNPDTDVPPGMLLFKFQNILPNTEAVSGEKRLKSLPSVLIATRILNAEIVIPLNTQTVSLNIEVDAAYLDGLFDVSERSPVLQSLLQNTQPLLFEQMVYPSMQKIVDELVTEAIDDTFKLFFLRVKAEELICRLLIELEKRDEKHLCALNNHDIHNIYKIKEQMLEHLETPPAIKDLAVCAQMSPSKLKRIFKQIFGDSIYSYYQGVRMKEAARLLKEEKLSVTDAGYRLGFTNLSHFSRAFREHIGMNPKHYSRS